MTAYVNFWGTLVGCLTSARRVVNPAAVEHSFLNPYCSPWIKCLSVLGICLAPLAEGKRETWSTHSFSISPKKILRQVALNHDLGLLSWAGRTVHLILIDWVIRHTWCRNYFVGTFQRLFGVQSLSQRFVSGFKCRSTGTLQVDPDWHVLVQMFTPSWIVFLHKKRKKKQSDAFSAKIVIKTSMAELPVRPTDLGSDFGVTI